MQMEGPVFSFHRLLVSKNLLDWKCPVVLQDVGQVNTS